MLNPYNLDMIITNLTLILLFISVALIGVCILLIYNVQRKNIISKKNSKELMTLRKIFNDTRDISILLDADKRVVDINNAGAAYFNSSRAQMIGQSLENNVFSSKSIHAEILQCINEGKVYRTHFEKLIGRHKKNFEFSLECITHDDEIHYLVHIINTDWLNEQEKYTHKVERRIEALESFVNIGYLEYDHPTKEAVWSRGVYNILDLPIDSTKPSTNLTQYLDPDCDILQASKKLMSVLSNQSSLDDTFFIRTPSGEKRCIRLYFSHQYDKNNNVTKTYGTMINITSLTMSRREAAYYENLLYGLLDHIGVLVFAADEQGYFSKYNQLTADFLGVDRKQLNTRKVSEFFGDLLSLPDITGPGDGYLRDYTDHSGKTQRLVVQKFSTRDRSDQELPVFALTPYEYMNFFEQQSGSA